MLKTPFLPRAHAYSMVLPSVAAAAVLMTALPGFAASPQEPPSEVTVRTVSVEGGHALPTHTIVEAVTPTAVGKPGSRDVIEAATRAVVRLYRRRGFPVAQVVEAGVTADGVLHLTVAEGRIRSIRIRGNRKTRTATILETLATRIGDAYNENDLRDDRNRLARLNLFNDVTITAQVPGATEIPDPDQNNDEKKKPDSDSSSPVSGGNVATSTPPASGEAGAKSGAPAGSAGTNAPDSRVGGGVSGPVDQPVIPPPPTGTALTPGEDEVGQVDLVVRVRERQTVNVAATVGYADAVGPVGFVNLSEENAAGTAQKVGVQWQRSSNSYVNSDGSVTRGDSRQAFSLSYERPALGLHSTAYSLDLYNQNTVFLPYFSGTSYTIRTYEKRNGVTGRIGRSLGRHFTAYLTARHDDVGYDFNALQREDESGDTIVPLPPTYVLANANGQVGALGTVLVADGRDAADNPHHGYLHTLTYEDSGTFLGGNLLFRQATLDLRAYTSLRHETRPEFSLTGERVPAPSRNIPVLALRVMSGYSWGDVPLPEQYFIGGYELLRGYELYSIYGDRMLLGSAELRAAISSGIQGVLFLDAGNAWLPRDSFGDGGVKIGGGIGLRFGTPIGPIRLDAAYGDQFRTYVSLGQSF